MLMAIHTNCKHNQNNVSITQWLQALKKCIWNTWLCAQKLCVNVPHLRLQNPSVENWNRKRVNMKNLPVWSLKSRSWQCSSPCSALYLDSSSFTASFKLLALLFHPCLSGLLLHLQVCDGDETRKQKQQRLKLRCSGSFPESCWSHSYLPETGSTVMDGRNEEVYVAQYDISHFADRLCKLFYGKKRCTAVYVNVIKEK